jgi:hypothetical protein
MATLSMSALEGKADMVNRHQNVRSIADMTSRSSLKLPRSYWTGGTAALILS